MIQSDRLEAFIAFAEHRSFTAASRALHVSQPALHVKIGKLAEEVGAALYRRHGRGLELTAEGERLLSFAREARERDALFLDELQGRAASAPVVLAAGEGAFLYLLGPAIRAFTRQRIAPLRVLALDRDATAGAVRSGEAHVGVGAFDVAPEGLAVDVLARVGAVVACPRGHRLARKKSVALADLEGERLIVPPAGRPHRETLSRALLSRGIAWESAVEATGWELALHFASLGLGLAVVNAFCRMPPGVVARPLPELPAITFHVIRRRGKALPAAAALRDAILAARR